MAQIDPSIALATRGPQINDPVDVYSKGIQLQGMMSENEVRRLAMAKNQRLEQEERTMADLYRGAVDPTGKLDRNALLSRAAGAGLGNRIPALQKGFVEEDAKRAETDDKKVGTKKTKQEMLANGLKLVDGAIASMLSDPNISDVKVAAEMGRLVRLGAFDAQAEFKGVTPDDAAKEIMSTMPVGNPQALRQWLIEAGNRTADASKRLELALPKFDEQDRGGIINEGTINQYTGQRTPGTDITKTNTPGEVLSAETATRGQDLLDSRGRQANAIAREGVDVQREAQRTQIIQTPEGFFRVDKGTGLATPVADGSGAAVLPADSKLAEDRKMAASMGNMITMGRTLLKAGPTQSGLGAFVDNVATMTGTSFKSGDLAASLEALGGWMTSNVPRMQGPQSDKDTVLYRQMAAQIADRTKPVTQRLAALDTVEAIMRRSAVGYTGAKPYDPAIAPTLPTPQNPAKPSLDSFFTK